MTHNTYVSGITYYRESNLIKSSKNKILNGNFTLTQQETNEVKNCIKNSFYVFTDFAYDQLSARNDKAIGLNKKYDQVYWEKFIAWMDTLDDSRLRGWFSRTIQYNLEIGVWNCKNTTTVRYLPAIHAVKAYLKLKDIKFVNTMKQSLLSLYGRKQTNSSIIDEALNYLNPDLFKTKDEYLTYLSNSAHKSIILMNAYEKLRDKLSSDDHNKVYKNINNIILYRAANASNKRLVFSAIRNQNIFEFIKNNYTEKHKDKLVKFINIAEYRDIEIYDFKLAKDLINLDSDLVTSLQERYIKSLISKRSGHIRANKDRMVKFLKIVPGTSPRKALLQLSQHKKNSDIEYIASKFPELKKLISLT